MKRIGLLTSGGDCQALNATMRGVVKGLANNIEDLEVYGFMNGYKGLIYGDYRMLTSRDFSGILTRGGTILGTSRQPFKLMRVPDEKGIDKVEAMKQTYYKLRLDCLVILGGNGTQKTANLLREEGLNIIHLPKTIDNDIWGTDMTFGFYSAVNVATEAIDCIHTTASSHNRVFIVEVMGHKVGWLTLYAGIASGADVILIPEIPYDLDKVVEAIDKRKKRGSGFTILAVAEGAISKEDAALPKKELKKKQEEYARMASRTVKVFMVEKKEALDNIDEICSVPGIDMVQFGPNDFALSSGFNMAENKERVREAELKMFEAAKKHGVHVRAEMNSVEDAQYYLDLGVRHFNVGMELRILSNFWKQQGSQLNEMIRKAGLK